MQIFQLLDSHNLIIFGRDNFFFVDTIQLYSFEDIWCTILEMVLLRFMAMYGLTGSKIGSKVVDIAHSDVTNGRLLKEIKYF
jgi:hypothetical protein